MARVKVHLLGGLNEIGGNKFLVEEDEHRLLLDFGTSIGARSQYFDGYLAPRSGAILRDLLRLRLLPDIDGLYRRDLLELARSETDKDLPESADEWIERTGRPLVDAVLVTHAHIDHFQDLAFVDPRIPVYCTETTRSLLSAVEGVTRTKVDQEVLVVKERSIGATKTGPNAGEQTIDTSPIPRDVRICPDDGRFRVGAFDVTAIPVDHSVPGACAFRVRTPGGTDILYTGDIRFHGALEKRTQRLREATKGMAPDLVLSEGTRIAASGGDDEAAVGASLKGLVDDCSGLAIAEFGWKDTTRFDTLEAVARETGRTLLVSPKLAFVLRQLGHLPEVPSSPIERYEHVNVYLRRRRSMLGSRGDLAKWELGYELDWGAEHIKAGLKGDDTVALRDALTHWEHGLRADDVRQHPERYILHLTFFEITDLFDLDPPPGSRWLRCATEPYSDEMTMDLDRQKRWLHHFGLDHNVRTGTPSMEDLNGSITDLTHVSGHASGDDILELLAAAEPNVVVPIHTEAEHLHRYDAVGRERATFPEYDFRDAARGRAVVEL